MKGQKRPMVEITVCDYKSKVLSNAKVTLKPLGEKPGEIISLKFDKQWQTYRAFDVNPGYYIVRAEAEGLESDEREVQVAPGGIKDISILGKKGMPFYYRGKVKVPFEPPSDLLGVSVKPSLSGKEEEELLAHVRKLKLQPEEIGEPIRKDNVRVFRFPPRTSEQNKKEIQQRLSEHLLVRLVGPMIRIDKESVSFLTNEIVVKFKAHITREEVPTVAKQYKLEVIRTIPYAGNAFLLRAATQANYDLLNTCAEIVKSGIVEYAEPNLVITAVDDQVNPTDFLYAQQWHIPFINLPDAWQALQNANPPGVMPGTPGDLTFGSENIIIAVMDRGIQSQTVDGVTTATHPDFNGTVTNGANKVYKFFDFANMAANNNAPPNNHGMGCAGVASALANNPSVVAGEEEGVAGAAPNCSVMGLIRPAGGTEVQYADAYIWAAGFNPNSTQAGFPALISLGADIITNSFGESIGVAISGLMRDCFDYLTTYGRGGKGVVLFFSAGNGNMNFTLQRPWAAYEKTIAVAASTNTDVRAGYSNFGNGIDVCAPSSDVVGITTCDLLGNGNEPGHAAQQTTLTMAAAAGGTTLTVINNAGFAVNQWILVGQPGQPQKEPVRIAAIPPGGTQLTITALLNNHPVGTLISGGPNNYRNNFGGTSSATPLTAGVAALMLSINPDLTWVEVRQILRDTAVQIDAANTDPIGQWVDTDGDGVTDYSQWYGHGRIDAKQAVIGARDYAHDRDIVIRENLADVGAVPSGGAFYNSPDIWVRNSDPVIDGAAALPATYGDAPPHQSPLSGQNNWVYVRFKNIGTASSFDFYIRVYITHFPGFEFTYPDSFIPTNRPGDPVPSPMTPGTYLIGEVHYSDLAAGANDTVNVLWPQALIPPQTVMVGGVNVTWHPCLLVELSPHDGTTPTGNHVWDNNNLAQKNISIIYPDADDTFATAAVVGNLSNRSSYLDLLIDRSNIPPQVQLYVELLDQRAKERLRKFVQECGIEVGHGCCRFTLLEETRLLIDCPSVQGSGQVILSLPAKTKIDMAGPNISPDGIRYNFTLGNYKGREVIWLAPRGHTRIPVFVNGGTLSPVIIGGLVGKGVKSGSYEVRLTQINLNGQPSGGIGVQLKIGK